MDSQWHGKCPCLIVFCLVHLTHMETGERALKASQAATFNGWAGQIWKGAMLQNNTDEVRTVHSGDESTGSKGLTDPKPPAAQEKSALKMSPVSNWALSLNCANTYHPSPPDPSPRPAKSTTTTPLVPELWQKGMEQCETSRSSLRPSPCGFLWQTKILDSDVQECWCCA